MLLSGSGVEEGEDDDGGSGGTVSESEFAAAAADVKSISCREIAARSNGDPMTAPDYMIHAGYIILEYCFGKHASVICNSTINI